MRNLELVLQQMHAALSALTSSEADDTVAKWHENPLEAWRRLQKRYPTSGGRKGNFVSKIISLGRCSLLELQAGIERWESYVSRYQKKLKDTFDDEIRLVGLEALVPEELEKHLIVTSNRLRTFEDARLKIVTYVVTKFGLRIRDSKPSETGSRGYCDPMDVDAINSSASGEGKGHRALEMVVSSAVELIFKETAILTQPHARAVTRKANRASHGPRGLAKERTRKVRETEHPKENPKVPKVRTIVKPRKLVSRASKTRNQRQVQKLWNLHRHTDTSWFDDGRSSDEWNDDWCSVGWHEGWEET